LGEVSGCNFSEQKGDLRKKKEKKKGPKKLKKEKTGKNRLQQAKKKRGLQDISKGTGGKKNAKRARESSLGFCWGEEGVCGGVPRDKEPLYKKIKTQKGSKSGTRTESRKAGRSFPNKK